jgi:hypothetical protein
VTRLSIALWSLGVVLGLLLGPISAALARDIPCGGVEPDVIQIDGLLNDWKDVQGLLTQDPAHIMAGNASKGWDGPEDLSFTTRCNYDDKRLYLAVDVHDERLVRTRKAQPAEDHVIFTFGGRKLVVWPADLHEEIPRIVKWEGKPLVPKSGIEVAESLQPKGWSLEVAIPLRLVPGWSPGVAQVRGTVAVADCDSKAPLRMDVMMSTGEGRSGAAGAFVFAEGHDLLEAFLDTIHARRSDVQFDKLAQMGGDPGLERVVRVGKIVGVIGKEYLYFEIPVADPRDVRDFRVLDLGGDGRHSVVIKYIERGSGGSREVLGVWKIVGPNFRRTFAMEVAKQQGPNQIVNRYQWVARGRAHDLVVEAGSAHGFGADNYREAPAQDMVPILLPWEGPRKQRFRFRGDEYFPVEK